MKYVSVNNTLLPANTPHLMPDNKAYRYGDGVFETMKVIAGEVIFLDYHIKRLFNGIQQLKYQVPDYFNEAWIIAAIKALCIANEHTVQARVRLSLYRGNGDISANPPAGIIIESYELTPTQLQHPLIIDIYEAGHKSFDGFSNLKTANSLLYSMAAIFARENNWQDCIILNQHQRVAETTIANIFWIKNDTLFTPPLSEGCVAGVMRQYLLDRKGIIIKEKLCEVETLIEADEIFLTNVIRGIRPVSSFRGKNYVSSQVLQLAAAVL